MLLDTWKSEFEMDKEFASFSRQIISSIHKAEEDVIKQVLKELLKRNPTFDDAKKVTRVFREGLYDKYTLAYDGSPLGIVEMNFSGIVPHRYCVNFTPIH